MKPPIDSHEIMVTPETLTDKQLRDLADMGHAYLAMRAFPTEEALRRVFGSSRDYVHHKAVRQEARVLCAEILNVHASPLRQNS